MNLDDPSKLSVRHRLRFLAKDSAIYGGAAAVNKAFALITFPLLARHFSVEDYGLIDLFSMAAALLSIVFIFGQDSAVARYFYETKDSSERIQIVSQSLMLQIGCIAVVMPILWAMSSPLARLFHASSDSPMLLKIILLQVPFLVFSNWSRNILKWTFSRRSFLFMSLGPVFIKVLMLLVAVIVFDIGVAGVFVVQLMVSAVFAGFGVFFVRQWITWPNGFGFLARLLPFAIPYGVIGCAATFVPVMERSLVDSLLGSDDLGLYAAGAKVAMLLMMVIQAFQTAWGPFALAIHKESDAAKTYSFVLKAFVLAICIAVLLLSTLGHSIIAVLASDRYAGASIVVFPLAMGLAIQGTSWITEIGIGLSKKSHLALYGYVAFVSVTYVSIYFLAGIFGLIGVALGVMAGHVAMAVIATWLAQRAYPLQWPYSAACMLLMITMLVGCFASWLSVEYGNISATISLMGGVALLLAVGWLKTLTGAERGNVMAVLRSAVASHRS